MKLVKWEKTAAIIIILVLLMSIPAVTAKTGSLRIITEPPGAQVTIDDEIRGVTPLLIPGLEFGEHELLLTVTGYEERTETIQVQNKLKTLNFDLTRKMSDLTLEPSVAFTKKAEVNQDSQDDIPVADSKGVTTLSKKDDGTTQNPESKVDLTVNTNPAGAKVIVTGDRGTKKGITPVTFEVIPAKYTVEIIDSLSRSHVTDITVGEEGRVLTLDLGTEEEQTPETEKVDLTITTNPAGAQVIVTGEKGIKKGVTPVTFEVIPSRYTVEIIDSQSRSHVTDISVGEEGRVLTLDLGTEEEQTPETEKVDLTITTNPAGVQVTVTGENGTKKGVTPVTFEVIPAKYTVEIIDSQSRSHVTDITVGGEGKVLTLDLESKEEQTPETEKVDLIINTNPSGAQVIVTGEKGTKKGVTPVTFEVIPAKYTVEIIDSQSKSHVTEITVGEEGRVLTRDLETEEEQTPETEKVDLTISTNPAGAQVTVTGENWTNEGVTPVTFEVIPARYTVEIIDFQSRAHVTEINVGEEGRVLTLDLETKEEQTPDIENIPIQSFEEQIADAIFAQTNVVRLENGVPSLQRNGEIDDIAQVHATYMSSINDSNHDNVEDRVDQVEELGFGFYGENCASICSGIQSDYCDHQVVDVANTSEGLAVHTIDILVNHDWCEPMNDGHRKNILNPVYSDIGIGISKGEDYYYVTQIFGGQ